MDIDEFKSAIKTLLKSSDGISVESEGSIYVRSLEGENYCAGHYSPDGCISEELEFNADLDSAIEYFMEQRMKENHG